MTNIMSNPDSPQPEKIYRPRLTRAQLEYLFQLVKADLAAEDRATTQFTQATRNTRYFSDLSGISTQDKSTMLAEVELAIPPAPCYSTCGISKLLAEQTAKYLTVFNGKIDLELMSGPGVQPTRANAAGNAVVSAATGEQAKRNAHIEQAKMLKEFNPELLPAYLLQHGLTEKDVAQ